MEVLSANLSHSEEICNLLVSKFMSSNQLFGYDKYKTNFDGILKHVSARISDDKSEFKYFVLLDESKSFLGFVNTMLTSRNAEILALCLLDSHDNKGNALKLLEFAVDYLRNLGAGKISAEVISKEKSLFAALKDLKAEVIEQKYLI